MENFIEQIDKRRTFAIISHPDAGKTTLSEQLLYRGGTLRRAGRVDSGDTCLDHDVIERSRGIEHGRPEPSRDADRGPDDPERAQAPGGDPRRKIPLREKVKLVREYADELSRTGRDARTPDRAAAQQRERK